MNRGKCESSTLGTQMATSSELARRSRGPTQPSLHPGLAFCFYGNADIDHMPPLGMRLGIV